MVADSDHSSILARRSAECLRDLREREYRQLTLEQLAQALDDMYALNIATIPLPEKPGSDRLPPPQRLALHARLFCTSRSFTFGAPDLLRDEELTEEERKREAEPYVELLALRERAQSARPVSPQHEQPAFEEASTGQSTPIWQLAAGEAVGTVAIESPGAAPHADQSSTSTFCVLMKDLITNNTALPSNLLHENVSLWEWSVETGARW